MEMNRVTICFITARREPKVDWFLDSLQRQLRAEAPKVIVVSLFEDRRSEARGVRCVPPKPNVWQGPHRLTKEDWWAISNARNTGICLCETDWIAFLDDRCILGDGWAQSVREAVAGGYAVCGAYEKRVGMEVAAGVLVTPGEVIGVDCREPFARGGPMPAHGQWFFGCTSAAPLEWALAINGYEERMDGLSFEDVIFGLMLTNAGYPLRYDPRMKIIEDRTPAELGTPPRRTDKGISPNDKSHAALQQFGSLKRAGHQWDLRAVRAKVLAGEPFPIPTGPTTDWYDGQPLAEF